jgi:hypothetical protein
LARSLPTHRTTQTQNKRTKISVPRYRFEPTIPTFARVKTAGNIDCGATVIGINGYGLDIGFTDHLYTQLGTTSNHSAITNLHTLQITTAPTKPFSSLLYF